MNLKSKFLFTIKDGRSSRKEGRELPHREPNPSIKVYEHPVKSF
jgi:hypothetical protein